MKGLEPPRLSAIDPKSIAATITPHPELVEPLGIEPQSFGFSVQRAHLLRQSSIRPHLGIEPSFFQKFGPGAPKEGNTYIRFEPTVRFELTCPIGS